MSKKLTTEEFIEKARKVHGDKYDYSKVEYTSAHVNVCIICPKHGEFWQEANNHILGNGCPECNKLKTHSTRRFTTEEFISEARKIHGDKYDYPKVKYVNNKTKVCIICPIHGEFWQSPYRHLTSNTGCPKCSNKVKCSKEEFIDKANKIHNHKYDYSKVEYINCSYKDLYYMPETR